MNDFSNRQIAVTFLEAHIEQDQARMSLVREHLTDDQLIDELASISAVLSSAIGLFVGNDNEPKTILNTLRKVLINSTDTETL